jgi:hypothetical protein
MLGVFDLERSQAPMNTPVYMINKRFTAFTSSLWIHDVKELPYGRFPPSEGCVYRRKHPACQQQFERK